MVTPFQIRAARAILDWTQGMLAERAKVTQSTIANIEAEKQIASKSTLSSITKAFQDSGIEFLDDGLRKIKGMFELSGNDCFVRLLENVYHTLRGTDHELLISGADERRNVAGVESIIHKIRAAEIKMRVLVDQENHYLLGPLNEYRCVPSNYFLNLPVIIYGDRVALVYPEGQRDLKIQVYINSILAESQRRLFNFMWSKMESPSFSEVGQVYL